MSELPTEAIRRGARELERLVDEIRKVLIGQETLVERLLVALLTQGHVLLEGVPGLAKTLAVKTMAAALDASFSRIQFTPDLLPADITGTPVFNPRSGEFSVKLGPIHANLVLADEINRAPAKVQSALLEGMAEERFTIGDRTYELPRPFLVLATQNPIEQEGTYPLPEAQMDRFLFKLRIGYPARDEERRIVDRMAHSGPLPEVRPVLGCEQILALRRRVDEVYLDDKIRNWIVDVVAATREPAQVRLDLERYVRWGSSPRASIALARASRALAFLKGRGYVVPQDVKALAMDVLRHRVVLSYEAQAEGVSAEDVIARILDAVEAP